MFFRTHPATRPARPAPRTARRAARRVAACEPLENRQLLAADLVATGIVGRIPEDLISGQRSRIPGLAVNVNNAGDANARAQVVTRLYASADGALDPADPQLVEQTNRLNIRAGRQGRVPIRVRDVPPSIPQGTYRLIAEVDVLGAVPEDNELNNWIASGETLTIGPPFVNLVATKVHVRPPVRADRPASMVLTVLNAGNSNARGSATVNVLFAPVGQTTGGTAVDAPMRISLRSRQTRPLRVRVPVPALPAGDYTMTATITTTVGFADANPADNSAATATTVR